MAMVSPWTEEDRVRFVSLVVRHGYSPEEVAKRVGTTRATVFRWVRLYKATGTPLTASEQRLKAKYGADDMPRLTFWQRLMFLLWETPTKRTSRGRSNVGWSMTDDR